MTRMLPRRIPRLATSLSIALALGPAAGAQLGPEIPVNTFIYGEQRNPSVALASSAAFIVAWDSYDADEFQEGVCYQRFDPSGAKLGNETIANTYVNSGQSQPAVGADRWGNFGILWDSFLQDSSGYGIFGQLFAAGGLPFGTELAINATTSGDQRYPAIGVDGASNFVAAWGSIGQDGSGAGVFARLFASTGVPRTGELQVNVHTAGYQNMPVVAVHGSGSFVVAWHDESQDGSSSGVYARRYDAAGAPLGGEFRVNTYVDGDQEFPAIAMDGDANFVVVWESQAQDGGGYGIYAQRFAAAGTPVGSEFRVNTTTLGDQLDAALAMDRWGNFVVAWRTPNHDGSGDGVFAQRFDSTGIPMGGEFQVNEYIAGNQQNPAVAGDGWGNYVFAWQSGDQDGSGYGIFARRLLATPLSDGFERGDLWRWSARQETDEL